MKLKISSESKTLALFIPSVQYDIPCKIIAAKFAARNLGVVSRIEWVENDAYPKYKRCFVCLTLAKSKNVEAMLSALKKPRGYRLYYSSREFWRVFVNKSSIGVAPPNVHMDIQITVPSGTDIDFVYAKLDAERIGKIAGYYLAPTCLDKPDTTIIGIVFEYWYRNKSAIALQQALLNTEFVELTVVLDTPQLQLKSTFNDECTNIDDCINYPTNIDIVKSKIIWRIHQSIYPPILSGISPYIWINHKQK